MYWLLSLFELKSPQDLETLIRIYEGVQGELTVLSKDEKESFQIEWQVSPFSTLKKDTLMYPCKLTTKLAGPQTLIAGSLKINKLDPELFEHQNKDTLLKWASSIDKIISFEMQKDNDMNVSIKCPDHPLSVDDLILAARLSKLATHVCITDEGIIATNIECKYAPWISCEGACLNSDLMFDKDDGYCSSFRQNIENMDYMKGCFNRWKESEYSGSLADYHHPYKGCFECSNINKSTA